MSAPEFSEQIGARSAAEIEPRGVHPAHVAARSLVALWSLHPGIAFLTIVVNAMTNTADIISAGLLLPVSLLAAIALGLITRSAQMAWAGDSRESANVKAGIVALLTAIPGPLPFALFIPMGVLGAVRSLRRRS
jgi:hypothetical protein